MPIPEPVRRELINTLVNFRKDAARQDAAVIRQLANAYRKLYERLATDLELELRRIYEQPAGTVTRDYLQTRLARLTKGVQEELEKYQAILSSTIDVSTDGALALGSKHAVELMKLATMGQKAIIAVNFGVLNPDQVNTMIAFLSPGSPLYKRIDLLAKHHAPIIRNQLVEAIARGYNPYKTAGNMAPFLKQIASEFQVQMARPFADAVRMARTAQLWAYREAGRANYQANSDVINGWAWHATLDGIVCPACLSMHGTVHPLDEPLDGHPHCRCTPIPIVLGNSFIEEGSGQAWFEKQDEATQRAILGKGAYEAWTAGKFEFDQLHKQVPDDVYGSFTVVKSLKELVPDDNPG